VQQLNSIDSIFVYNETRNSPMHISPLMFYDVGTAPGGFVRFKDILHTFRTRLNRSPVFRRKLLRVPLDLGYPYWIEDADFDLEFHVRHLALPKPGDWRQFCILLARLHSRPLDLSRPPWEAYIIEGLDNIEGLPPGSFAMYMKIHHSAIDGATGNQIVEALHDLSPESGSLVTADPWRPEAEPSPVALLRRMLGDLGRQPRQLLDLTRQVLQARQRVQHGFGGQPYVSHEVRNPIRFTGRVSPHRVFGGVHFELQRFKAIKDRIGNCTINDVVLGLVGGSLRKYLQAHQELPGGSLVAGVPVSVRVPGQESASGNQVSGMRIHLCTDIDDPAERVRRINQDAVRSKAYQNALGAEHILEISGSVPASLLALGMRIGMGTGMSRRRPLFHTVVTNVPGPQRPLYMCGARMVWWFGAGALADGLGLFHTITSYGGQIAVAYLSCRRLMPDPQTYDRCIQEAFEELEAAAAGRWQPQPPRAPKVQPIRATRRRATPA
jgi:diacylglycerol O-acyltransferase